MEQFLKTIAHSVYQSHHQHLDELCLLFPNKRAGLFFNKYLAELIEKPVFTPVYYTISEFFQRFTDLNLTDNLQLIFKLYMVYQDQLQNTETFDEFLPWGEILLNDFDDIDKYLVNAESLFKNLESVKEIEYQFSFLDDDQIKAIKQFWNAFRAEKYSKQQEQFLYLWKKLWPVYQGFKKTLSSSNMAYEGMMLRDVIENRVKKDDMVIPFRKICITGFNALNQCEEELFQYLQHQNLSEFYWDYDVFYTDPSKKHHEAGRFIRENLRKFPQTLTADSFDNLESDKEKDIQMINAISETGQTKLLPELLNHIPEKQKDENTAIVLTDESLLQPLLRSLPEDIRDINITMGYPVRNSFVFGLIENLINLQQHAFIHNNQSHFRYQDVFAVLKNAYIKPLGDNITAFIHEMEQSNQLYINPSAHINNPFLKILFTRQNSTKRLINYILTVLYEIFKSLHNDNENNQYVIEKEIIYKLYTHAKRIKDIIEVMEIDITYDTLLRLMKKSSEQLSVSFSGEPLKGLQVLGILETRILDFKHVIILSMNEGTYPKKQPAPSFIPFNIRKGFHMPTIQNQDSIYAYYFYRLIQRAKNIRLLYHSRSGGLQTGEPSRFLYQLKYEPEFNLQEKTYSYHIDVTDMMPFSIEKSEKVRNKLRNYLHNHGKKYLSPSAVNTYIDCPLKFYFRYIARLEEPEELLEEPDAIMFGNILHGAMAKLYRPYIHHEMTREDLEQIIKDDEKINKVVDEAFHEEFFRIDENDLQANEPKSLLKAGQHIIVFEIIQKYVRQILETDKQYVPFIPLHLEHQFTFSQSVNSNGHTFKVNLGGKIDRIDSLKGETRIIDYKTGKFNKTAKSVEDLFSRSNHNRNKNIFQVMFYAYMYARNKSGMEALLPGIYGLKSIYGKNFNFQLSINRQKVDNARTYFELFEENLASVLKDIFHPQVPFNQTENPEICKNCPYNKICQKI